MGAIDRQIEDHRRDPDPHPRWRAAIDARIAELNALIAALTPGVEAPEIPVPAGTTPAPVVYGAPGAPGSAATYARGDHSHQLDLPPTLGAIADLTGVGVVQRDDEGDLRTVQQADGQVAVWDASGLSSQSGFTATDLLVTVPSLRATDQAGTGERMVAAGADGDQRAVAEVMWETNGLAVTKSVDGESAVYWRCQNPSPAGSAQFYAENDNLGYVNATAYGSGFGGSSFGIGKANLGVLIAQGNLTAFAVGSFSAIPVILGYNDAEAARIDAGGFRFAQQIQVTADAGTGQRMLTAQPDGHHAPIAAVTWDGADIRVNTRQVAQRYIHTQGTPSATWTIIHNLGCYPSVTVVDSGGTVGWAEVVYDSANQLRVLLASAQAGNAYLN